ncbi:MAG: hypothetical protein ABFS39_19810 [Pseudomonadota bacterium]
MCHAFLNDAKFYRFLFDIDQDIAHQVQAGGCSCGGVLHSACYPRKPRGIRSKLDESYKTRLSFCCAEEGCRRRSTPPSVRFLGRKVYLGVMVILITALEHGLSPKRQQWLIETLDIWPQTLSRWRKWWRAAFPASRCWQEERGRFIPPVETDQLPGTLLGRLDGKDLRQRLCYLLLLLTPITTTSWSGYLRVITDPQKM